tara:strand:- start:112 stop:675 length:564 start_codon:yes stop_codon:yes gene_type:complete
MKRIAPIFALGIFLTIAARPHSAQAQFIKEYPLLDFEAGMDRILIGYLAIHQELIHDRVHNVKKFARQLAVIVKQLNKIDLQFELEPHFKYAKKDMLHLCRELMKAKTLKEMRLIFRQLSRPLVEWASFSQPHGVVVLYCPVADASWVQLHGTVLNPFFGHKLLHSGIIIGGGPKIEGKTFKVKENN